MWLFRFGDFELGKTFVETFVFEFEFEERIQSIKIKLQTMSIYRKKVINYADREKINTYMAVFRLGYGFATA